MRSVGHRMAGPVRMPDTEAKVTLRRLRFSALASGSV